MDGDHWDQEVTLANPESFQVGDGVRLVSKDPYGKGTNIVQRTLIAASGNRFKLDRRLEEPGTHRAGPLLLGHPGRRLRHTDTLTDHPTNSQD